MPPMLSFFIGVSFKGYIKLINVPLIAKNITPKLDIENIIITIFPKNLPL